MPVDDWATVALEDISIPIRSCTAHGDLHGGNLLLAGWRSGLVIDFGRLGTAAAALDPITLELSAVLHPDAGQELGDWPSRDQALQWMDLDAYVADCPIAEFVAHCRAWARDIARGDREQAACVYGYALRQLRFPEVDANLAAAYGRGAAERLLASQ